jgi:hypothetical protein
MTRPTWKQALKDIAIRIAHEAERYVGASDTAACTNSACGHMRSQHCGCGMHCFGSRDGGTAHCECQGFAHPVESSARKAPDVG